MNGLILSQSAIFYIQQLSMGYFRNFGVRYRISTEEGILTLLQKTANRPETDIRKNYDAFVMELNQRQVQQFEAKGINCGCQHNRSLCKRPGNFTAFWL